MNLASVRVRSPLQCFPMEAPGKGCGQALLNVDDDTGAVGV